MPNGVIFGVGITSKAHILFWSHQLNTFRILDFQKKVVYIEFRTEQVKTSKVMWMKKKDYCFTCLFYL